MVDLSVRIGKLELRNPTILASGIMDETADSIKRVAEEGAGAVVTKSVGKEPREGYANPTVVELEHGILNAMGLPNPGIEAYADEMEELRDLNIPVIGSIFGSDEKEFSFLARKMQEYGARAIELNLSCPHASGYGAETGSQPDVVKSIVHAVKHSVDLPVFAKLTSNVTSIVEIGKAAEEGGADGVVAINSIKAMKIDVNLKKPILSNKVGGYSGPAIKPIGIRCVYELAQELNIPIIGVGGIKCGEDAVEYILAGASAVQIGGGIYYRDMRIFREVCKEMENWMKSNNYSAIEEFRGVALR
ncbi:MAG TPA: dihydroorotate dehydrogenase [Thermoplasmatales archaeon]|nr:dihydroorotate dehydrogenase [Thermoplasmatales archaeon]